MLETIHTERLVLRRFQGEDAARVTELIGQLSVARWLTQVPHPYTLQDAMQFFDRHAEDDNVQAITLAGAVIGCCAIDKQLGYWLGEPYWGQGYATEAAQAVVDRYFTCHIEPLESGYAVGNAASARVLSKLGFVSTSIEDAHCAALNKRVTLQKMSLSKDAWERRS